MSNPYASGATPPPAHILSSSKLGRWMRELGMETYDELHRYSVANMETFIESALRKLGIRFRKPYDRLLDLSGGVEHPVWFAGARMNITDSVFNTEAGFPAIVSRKEGQQELRVTSTAELEHVSARVANGLSEMGFKPRDAIAVVMPMTPECVAIYLGIVRAGMAVVSIADSFAPDEISTRLAIANARAVFTEHFIRHAGKTIPLYPKVAAAKAPVAIVVGAGTPGPELRDGDIGFDRFLSTERDFDNVSCDPGDTINVLFSSGTTRAPKAIPWNHTTPVRSALDGFVHQDIQPGDVVAWPTNVGWMMGPWLIFASLINWATIALYEGTANSLGFGQFVQDAGVTMLGVVPSLVRSWRTIGGMTELDWNRIRVFSSTGEASNAEDMRWLSSLAGGKPVIEYCGGTEIGGAYITSTVVQTNRPSCFSAKAIASDFVILDETGAESAQGEAWLVPPVLGHSTRLLNADHRETYFEGCPPGPRGQVLRRHGDEIQRLEGGFYRAEGRTDDTMNLGGIKVGSVELERVMNRVDGVVETAAIAVSPAGGGPSELVVYAVTDPDPDTLALKARLQQRIRADLNPLFKISQLSVVAALPRTASNKVMRRTLRARHSRGGRGAGLT